MKCRGVICQNAFMRKRLSPARGDIVYYRVSITALWSFNTALPQGRILFRPECFSLLNHDAEQ